MRTFPITSNKKWRRDDTKLFLKNPLTLLKQSYEEQGEFIYLNLFGFPNLFLIGPEAAKFVLQDMAPSFSAREGNLQVAKKLFGSSILFQDGDVHGELKRAVKPAFDSHSIQEYLPIMAEVIRRDLLSWIFLKEVDIYKSTQRIALEIVAQTLYGTSIIDNYHYVQSNIEALASGLYANNLIDMPWTYYGKGLRSHKRLKLLFLPVITHYRKHFAVTHNMMELLVSRASLNSRQLTDAQIMDQINTFLFAGYDTSSSLMAWAIWYVLSNRDVYETLYREIKSLTSFDGLTVEAVNELKYLDCVVKETERLCPPVYFIPRMALHDTIFNQRLIPRGWLVNISPLLSHRLSFLFANPDRFDPWRFLPPREEHKRNPLSLIGFGVGPKACIGRMFAQLEIKLFLIMTLGMYTLSLKTKAIEPSWIPSLHPKNGPVVTIN